ncbi:alpha/beta fold hydrolase [Streptomyces orinoci]|uniref:Alpha/beta hydrolase n=1 Tax=Streptomyces orinoci TaxID=67339 RepID=A0ABV3JY14_STRON|nr:alpha/beta hydrolase [Streptomyces orinoci]
MTAMVLVPGFWLGAWVWEEVARELRAAGHTVYPVTLTGVGERAGEAAPGVGVETHITDLVRLIEDHDLREVLLVAHSGATVPVTGAAERLPGRIARLVYLDSAPLPAGVSVLDANPREAQEEWRRQVAERGEGRMLPPPPFDRPDDGELAGLTGEHLARLRRLATPEPFAAATGSLELPKGLPPVPRSLISCTSTPEQVRQWADSGHPLFAPLAGMEVHHLPTGHWPMLSRPVELAALLASLSPRTPAG